MSRSVLPLMSTPPAAASGDRSGSDEMRLDLLLTLGPRGPVQRDQGVVQRERDRPVRAHPGAPRRPE